MSFAQQLTGCNAVFSYGPNITESVVSASNRPLASRYSLRQMFLVGTAFASAAGLLTGVPLYPGVASEDTRRAFAIAGVALFFLAF
jgi:quinol-cytochrome oxidoreductase complex cytochrome b subunit